EFAAMMLGTSRPTVTVVAGTLQKAGLIKYHRGHVTVVDRENLETASCECYQTATDLLKAVTRRSYTMNAPSTRDTDVLIAGAGPTGLVLALWLMRLGVRVRIVDKTAEPGTTSRALAVQARTLELYRQIGFADALLANGIRLDAVYLWVGGRKVARAAFGAMGVGLSRFPYAVIFPQDEPGPRLV